LSHPYKGFHCHCDERWWPGPNGYAERPRNWEETADLLYPHEPVWQRAVIALGHLTKAKQDYADAVSEDVRERFIERSKHYSWKEWIIN
jgi:hypothetical protein